MQPAPPNSDAYLRHGSALATELAAYAQRTGASQLEIGNLIRIAERALPITVFELHAGEIEPGASAFASCLRLISAGIGAAALTRRDIPLELRERLMPALRPDTFESHIVWWDRTALPNWVAPFFLDLEERGLFDSATSIAAVERFGAKPGAS